MFRWLRACLAMLLVLALGLGTGRALCPTMARGEACATMACGAEAATRFSCHPGDPTKFSQNAKLNPKAGSAADVADRDPAAPDLAQPWAWWGPTPWSTWPQAPPVPSAWAAGPASPPPEA